MEFGDGEVVWVKLGPCWWPGEVWGPERVPPGIAKSFRKPTVVVKFFQEQTFEYVKSAANIDKYDCARKRDFIRRGLDLHRAKHSNMDKFPEDVATAETRTGGDPDIVDDRDFLPRKRESYAGLFASPEPSASPKKGASARRGRPPADAARRDFGTPRTIHPRMGAASDYRARILVQPRDKRDERPPSPRSAVEEAPPAAAAPSNARLSSSSSLETYSCHSCAFTTNRLNTLVIHNKSHVAGVVPPSPARLDSQPVRPSPAADAKRRKSEPKPRKPKTPTSDRPELKNAPPKRKPEKARERHAKKPKTEVEIKNSLLADWNEDSNDESADVEPPSPRVENRKIVAEKSPEAKSTAAAPVEPSIESSGERKRASCFDFEEDDDDLAIENIGKKIPRLGGKSDESPKKSAETNKDERKTEDDDDGAKIQKEIAEFDSAVSDLLKETAVPDLPAIPPTDANVQKSDVKIPDKQKIFKTKSFFRSRHSRSQDAIEKYVADNTGHDKPFAYMQDSADVDKSNDASDNPSATSDSQNSDELGASKIEPVRVAKFAPKIQLKKMSAALSKNKTDSETKTDTRPTGDVPVPKDTVDEKAVVKEEVKISGFNNLKSNQIINVKIASEERTKESFSREGMRCEQIEVKESNSKILSSPAREDSKTFQIIEGNKRKSPLKILSTKIIQPPGKEKILNFDVSSQSKSTPAVQKQIIVRRAVKPLNSESDSFNIDKTSLSQDNLVLKGKWGDGNVQTFTIEDSGERNEVLLDPKIKKVLGKSRYSSKPHNTIITSTGDIIQSVSQSEPYDINNMPIVLSDDIIEPAVKPETYTMKSAIREKTEPIQLNRNNETQAKKSIVIKSIEKTVSPNILRSTKSKAKNFIVVDRNTGERKILTRPADLTEKILRASEGTINTKLGVVTKSPSSPLKSGNKGTLTEAELGAILSSAQTQNLKMAPVITSQEKPAPASKNAIMIITNAQGAKSKVLLTPEHQKILFSKGKIPLVPSSSAKPQSSPTAATKIKNVQPIITSSQVLSSTSHLLQRPRNIILNSKGQVISSGSGHGRPILTTRPGDAILTSKGQLIAPHSSIITTTTKLPRSPVKSNILLTPSTQPRQSISKLVQNIEQSQRIPNTSTSVVSKSPSSKNIIIDNTNNSGIPQSKTKTIMHYLTPTAFKHYQKTGEIISTRSEVTVGKPQQLMQKYIGTKQPQNVNIESRLESTQSVSHAYKTVPPLTPIDAQKSRPAKTKMDMNRATVQGATSNSVNISVDTKVTDIEESLIPATIIRTRKNETPPEENSVQSDNSIVEQLPATTTRVDNATSNDLLAGAASNSTIPESQLLETENALTNEKQLLAIPGENFGGPPNSFFLCVQENGVLTPVDNQPLVLENNQLVPMTGTSTVTSDVTLENTIPQSTESEKLPADLQTTDTQQTLEVPVDPSQQHILINIGEQQILVDHQTLLSLVAGDGQQLVTSDGQHLVFQGNSQQILAALTSNPELASLLAGNQQFVTTEQAIVGDEQQSIAPSETETFNFRTEISPNAGQDILAAALAGTEVLAQDSIVQESEGMLLEMDSLSPNVQNFGSAHVVNSNVFETSSTLSQPIMSPVEAPTTKKSDEKSATPVAAKNLDDSLADIGVTVANIPTSLELPITVTNPRIAANSFGPSGVDVYQSSSVLSSAGLYDTSDAGPNDNVQSAAEALQSLSSTNLDKTDSPPKKVKTKGAEKFLAEPVQNVVTSMPLLDDLHSETVSKTHEEIISNEEGKAESSSASMPSLDDVNSASNKETAEDVQTKVYSPISMPILTDDSADDSTAQIVQNNHDDDNVADSNVNFEQKSDEEKNRNETAVENMNEEIQQDLETVEENRQRDELDISERNDEIVEAENTIANENIESEELPDKMVMDVDNEVTESNEINEDVQSVEKNLDDVSIAEKTEDTLITAAESDHRDVPASEEDRPSDKLDAESTGKECENPDTTGEHEEESHSHVDAFHSRVDASHSHVDESHSHVDESHSRVDASHSRVDASSSENPDEEICAETPPHITDRESSTMYDDDDDEPPFEPNDETNVSCSSESAALPDSTSPNVEGAAPPPPGGVVGYSESSSSSDASDEIPIQPALRVPRHFVQNVNDASTDRGTENDVVLDDDHIDENEEGDRTEDAPPDER